MAETLSYTYDSLSEDLIARAEDTTEEFIAEIPKIIARGESRVYGDLNLEIFDRVRTGALTASQYVQAIKTSSWQGTRSFFIRDAGGTGLRRYLRRRTYEYCLDYQPDETDTDEPIYYAEYSETEFFVSPAPDAAYAFELREVSVESALALSSTQQSTWLATSAGDLLVASCMIEAQMFLEAMPEDVQVWRADYERNLPVRRAILRELIRAEDAPVANAPRTVNQVP